VGRRRLTVVRPGLPLPPPAFGETVVAFDEFARWIRTGGVIARPMVFAEARMRVHRLETAGRPLPLALAMRWMTRGEMSLEDERGRTRRIDARTLVRWARQVATEPFRIPSFLRDFEAEVDGLERTSAQPRVVALDVRNQPLYLRSDLSFGIRAGGSVGHIAGVVNTLRDFTAPPIVITTDDVATIEPSIERHLVAPSEAFWNFAELPSFVLNRTLEPEIPKALAGRKPSFVYQRYSLNNFTGLKVARQLQVPFVLEYNGSEVWVSRYWGRPLKYEALSRRVESLNLRAADLLVVVSQPIKDQVVALGVDERRVLVNPNGVDVDRYRPDLDGTAVRARYGLHDTTVIGFIGTFGPWHGAEVLAHAYVKLRASHPELASRLRLLMIGTGATLNEVRRILSDGGALDATVFTGLVPQEDGPQHLAACDVLVSPHVPNSDGTPFFGSPTKLFEYMAMGKGIVASRLDQIGEVLDDGKTALLVPPGDVDALSAGIARLSGDRALRECLGANARRVAVERHTWREHTKQTIEQLARLA
jgi:glycosyltransferase involved in cell wall biosynthesis